jgi:hypothetical protein
MSINTAPKYSKIELLIKNEGYRDTDLRSTTKIEFLDCGLIISGNHLIIVIDERNDINNSLTSTGRIFNLKEISAYKTYAL